MLKPEKWMSICLLLLSASLVWGQWSFNVGAVSDYVWRGYSQTQENPALQGGADVSCPLGFYAGTWASNVEFGDETDVEIDVYGGYSKELDNGLSFDVGYVRYLYNDFDDSDEGYAGLSYKMFSAKVYRGFEFEWTYLEAGAEFPLPGELGLNFHVGNFDYASGEGTDYMDWKAGITRSAWGLDFELAFTDTDLDDDEYADARIYLSVLKTW